jgi:hypothetical protein
VSDPPPGPVARPGASGAGDGKVLRRPRLGWRGRLTSVLMGAAGGIAVNDLSGTLGYRGLAGLLAVAAVAAATAWMRGLDARAWLPRHAPQLFLIPAAAAAAAAAFSSGSAAAILTAAAVVLTAGAVLLATGLQAAAWLLQGAASIGGGAAVIGLGVGVALIGFGAAALAGRDMLSDAACQRGQPRRRGARKIFYARRGRDDLMNDWLDGLAPIDWMNQRSTWQFFSVYVICTSAGGLLGAGVIGWIAAGHASVRLLIIFGVAFPLITAIPFTLKHRSEQSSSAGNPEP